MYNAIKAQPTTREIYAKLVEEGTISLSDVRQMEDDYRQALEAGDHVVKSLVKSLLRNYLSIGHLIWLTTGKCVVTLATLLKSFSS